MRQCSTCPSVGNLAIKENHLEPGTLLLFGRLRREEPGAKKLANHFSSSASLLFSNANDADSNVRKRCPGGAANVLSDARNSPSSERESVDHPFGSHRIHPTESRSSFKALGLRTSFSCIDRLPAALHQQTSPAIAQESENIPKMVFPAGRYAGLCTKADPGQEPPSESCFLHFFDPFRIVFGKKRFLLFRFTDV